MSEIIKIGFIDYYLDEWHANNYPEFIRKASGGKAAAVYAYGHIDSPKGGRTTEQWCKDLGLERCMTIDEVITLASIIEKESRPEDFAKVSAVFHNRLNQGMKLQSCPTLQYALGIKRIVLTAEDIASDSPYNTYINKGLPPGPICNPSEAAIKAALYPDEVYLEEGYLYFCLGDPKTGETVFAKTLKEHEANQAKYLKLWQQADAEMEKGNG